MAEGQGRPRRPGEQRAHLRLLALLITRRLTNLWANLATGFAYAPDRRRETVGLTVGLAVDEQASQGPFKPLSPSRNGR